MDLIQTESTNVVDVNEKTSSLLEQLHLYNEEIILQMNHLSKEELKNQIDQLDRQRGIRLTEEDFQYYYEHVISLFKFRSLIHEQQHDLLEHYMKQFSTQEMTQKWLITSNHFYVLKTRIKKHHARNENATLQAVLPESTVRLNEEKNENALFLSLRGTYDHYELAKQLNMIADLILRSPHAFEISLELAKTNEDTINSHLKRT